METIMSTLTWGPAVAAAAGPPQSLLGHLLKAYQEAERQNEARLARLGFAPEEIAALHQGRLQGPGHRLASRSRLSRRKEHCTMSRVAAGCIAQTEGHAPRAHGSERL